MKSPLLATTLSLALATVLTASSAYAQTGGNRMKACADEWNTMKAAKQTEGKKYRDFQKECLARTTDTATPAATPAAATPAATPAATTPAATPAATTTTAQPGGDNSREAQHRPAGHGGARARLRRGLESRQGRRQGRRRHDLAEVLERLRQAQEGRGHVVRAVIGEAHSTLEETMRRIIFAALFTSIAASAYAQSPPAPTPSCKIQATDKKLAGAAMTSFMKKCQTDATTSCNTQADGKKLAGAARTSFTKKCVTDATGT